MKKIILISALFTGLIFAANAQAGDNYRKTPEYQKIDNQARTDLKECLNNKNHSIDNCVEKTKKSMKMHKKQLKKSIENRKD